MKLSEIKEKLGKSIESVKSNDENLAESLEKCVEQIEDHYLKRIKYLEDEIYDKEEEIDDLEDEVKDLERKISNLEDEVHEFPVTNLEEEMKVELLQVLFNKYSLTELEQKLGGNKFTL